MSNPTVWIRGWRSAAGSLTYTNGGSAKRGPRGLSQVARCMCTHTLADWRLCPRRHWCSYPLSLSHQLTRGHVVSVLLCTQTRILRRTEAEQLVTGPMRLLPTQLETKAGGLELLMMVGAIRRHSVSYFEKVSVSVPPSAGDAPVFSPWSNW